MFMNYSSLKSISLLLVFSLFISIRCQTSCPIGQYLDQSSGECLLCGSTCNSCRNSTTCDTCPPQLFISGAICVSCFQIQPGCQVCNTSTTCTLCSSGFFLGSDNICRDCIHLTPNCLLCANNGTECLSCKIPYVMKSGSCVLGSNPNGASFFRLNPDNTSSSLLVSSKSTSSSFQPQSPFQPQSSSTSTSQQSVPQQQTQQPSQSSLQQQPQPTQQPSQQFPQNQQIASITQQQSANNQQSSLGMQPVSISVSQSSGLTNPQPQSQAQPQPTQPQTDSNCPSGQTLVQGNCVQSVPNCATYSFNGMITICTSCVASSTMTGLNNCTAPTVQQPPTQQSTQIPNQFQANSQQISSNQNPQQSLPVQSVQQTAQQTQIPSQINQGSTQSQQQGPPQNSQTQCTSNQFTTPDGSCANLVLNCLGYDPSTWSCQACVTSFVLTQGQCINPSQSQSQPPQTSQNSILTSPQQTQINPISTQSSSSQTNQGIQPTPIGQAPSAPSSSANPSCTFPCSTCSPFDQTYCLNCVNGYSLLNQQFGSCVLAS